MSYMSIEMSMAAGAAIPVSALPSAGGPLALAGGLTFHAKPGDLLQGNLVVHVAPDKELKINSKGIELYFRGAETTTITIRVKNGKHSSRNHTMYGGGELFRYNAPTVQLGMEHVFQRNTIMKFPFAFQVPACPHSLAVALDYEGMQPEDDQHCRCQKQRSHKATAEVRYEIKALAHVAGIFTSNLPAQTEIIVDPVYPIAPNPMGLNPVTSNNMITIPDYCCCDLFGAKPVSATVSVPKVALTNGEVLPVTIAIQNDSDNPVVGMTVALQNTLIIRVEGRLPQVTRYQTVHRTLSAAQVAAHTKETIVHSLPIANLTPDVLSRAYTSTSTLLVQIQLRGHSEKLNIRLPLHTPYNAGSVLMQIGGPSSSPVASFPGAPVQQSMGGPAAASSPPPVQMGGPMPPQAMQYQVPPSGQPQASAPPPPYQQYPAQQPPPAGQPWNGAPQQQQWQPPPGQQPMYGQQPMMMGGGYPAYPQQPPQPQQPQAPQQPQQPLQPQGHTNNYGTTSE